MKRLISSLAVILLSAICLATPKEDLERLEAAMSQIPVYDNLFLTKVGELEDLSHKLTDRNQIYEVYLRLAEAYSSYNYDKALSYLTSNLALAESLRDRSKLIETNLELAKLSTRAGYHMEAMEYLSKYSEEDIPQALLHKYYDVQWRYMTYLYNNSSVADKPDVKASRGYFRDKLLDMAEPDSWEWNRLKYEDANMRNDSEDLSKYGKAMIETAEENTKEYAESCFFYSLTFKDDKEVRLHWLVSSAVADMITATKDYASLSDLTHILFDWGELERAFRYCVDYSMPDALFYNGKLRPLQISKFFPKVEKEYEVRQAMQKKKSNLALAVLCLLLLSLAATLIILTKRHKTLIRTRNELQASKDMVENKNNQLAEINEELSDMNRKMQDLDTVKQEYITLFLSMLSENISSKRKYMNHVLKCLKTGNSKDLEEEIGLLPPEGEEINEFYRIFDTTFISIFPDFVDKFNALLMEGEGIIPKGPDQLTPELRIYALIKLGITNPGKIASLLHYSSNTIYNYKAKIRNKARDERKTFEKALENI